MTKTITKMALVDENETYVLWTAEIPGLEIPCYGVFHKKWDICEMSTSVLANARKFLTMLHEWEVNPKGSSVSNLPDFGPEAYNN